MSIATAITNAQGRVAACYTSVDTMGGTLPETQNLANLPTAIESIPQGGGGDLIFAKNMMQTTPVQGDKVIVTFDSKTAADSVVWGPPTYVPQLVVTPEGKSYVFNSTNSTCRMYQYINGSFSYVNYGSSFASAGPAQNASYVLDNGIYTICSGNNFWQFDYNSASSPVNNATFLDLKSGLKIKGSNGYIYDANETESYDCGIGGNLNMRTVQLFGDTVVIASASNVVFVDISSFPFCTKTTYNLPATYYNVFGVTGIESGSYLLAQVNQANTIVVLKFNGSSYSVEAGLPITATYYKFIDVGQKIVTGINGTVPYCCSLDSNGLHYLEIPEQIRSNFTEMFAGAYRLDQGACFACNRNMTMFSYVRKTGNSSNNWPEARNSSAIETNKWCIYEPVWSNYGGTSSFTGVITGNTDLEGNYEVSTVLTPTEEVTLTYTSDYDAEITFEEIV